MDSKVCGSEQNVGKRPRYLLLKCIAVIAAAGAVLGMMSYPLKTVSCEVSTDKVTKPVRIVQISDLHSSSYGKNMQELIAAVDEASPDIIVLTGDIYDDIADNKNTSLFLENIGKRYTCFYIAGNHEHRTDMWKKKYKAQAEGFGICVLEGENVRIGEITICGAARSADGSLTTEEAVKKCAEKAEGFSVLLCHYPENIDFYRSFGCFDLVMCGHAHGGQWRIPGVINGFYAPGEGLFPKYAGGRYDFEDSVMIVSRGLARKYVLVPRIFNNPEVVVCDILPEKEEL